MQIWILYKLKHVSFKRIAKVSTLGGIYTTQPSFDSMHC